jgi:predicted ATPase
MEGKRVIQSLRLRNLLSFGPDSEEIVLEPLNVLIGRNASGKSNLIEAVGLLAATTKDLAEGIRKIGGMQDMFWKGVDQPEAIGIEATVVCLNSVAPLKYRLRLSQFGPKPMVIEELIAHGGTDADGSEPFYEHSGVKQTWRSLEKPSRRQIANAQEKRTLIERENPGPVAQSVLVGHGKQPISVSQNPELDCLAAQFSEILIQKPWDFGRHTDSRKPQRTDLPGDFLFPDASNLSLVLNQLEHNREPMRQLMQNLRKLYDGAENITTRILGGTVQTFVHEKGLTQPIPATRLSDGTLRYLCLLTILCHPSPPPVVCLEEPELGMHPDVLPTIAELLVDASKRTQIIVTTHSDMLVSALSDHPEAIMVCENDGSGTKIRRLEPDKLKEWLKDYSLGELWLKGEIGGTRW